jgi:hypothetical protein
MANNKPIIKGFYIGIVIFIVTRLISRFCLSSYDMYMLKNPSWSLLKYYAGVVLNVFYFSCRPLSSIFCVWKGDVFKDSPILLKYAIFILRGLDLVFWVSLSIIILSLRNMLAPQKKRA